jgi:Clr5 domain
MDRTGKAVLGQRLEEGMTTLTDSTLARAIYPGLTLMQISMAAPEEDGNGSRSTSTSKPSPKDWNRLKAEFTFYYMAYNKKGLPLREVRAILARKYGFIAS